MAENYAFPDELREAQRELHAARARLAKLYARLPQYTDSWTDEERDEAAELWRRQRELAAFVSTHAFWTSLEGEERVRARSAIKHLDPGPEEARDEAP